MYGGFNVEDLGSNQDCLGGDVTGGGVSDIGGAGLGSHRGNRRVTFGSGRAF
jgi:hypothetical protein